MNDVPELTVEEAAERLRAGTAVFVDVRDPMSYDEAHVPGAVRVNDDNLETFVSTADKSRPLIVYCYHGFSSMGGAAYFLENGFAEVYSMTGGFEEWRSTQS